MRLALPGFRTGALLGAGACAALLGYGFWLQYADGQIPCPLCLVQRGFYFAVMAVLLVAAAHGPARGGRVAYGTLAGLFALGGGITAARQVWLQHLPADKVPQCGPDLYFMLENLPLSRTLQKLIQGTGECAEVHWRFLGLSIAEWSLACFAALLALAAWLALQRRRAA